MAIRTKNPASGEIVKTFNSHSDSEVDAKLDLARRTFEWWRHVPFTERRRAMEKAAEQLESRKQELARMMALEMGKPVQAGVQEAEKCARTCRFYAERAEIFLAEEPASIDGARGFVRYQPLGPVLAIMPWNFPFWQVFRFAAPGLMAGNVGLLKHASNVPQCAVTIEEIFHNAGFPEGAFQTLLIGSDRTAKVIEDDRIAAVTLTGSVAAGSSVGATAGRKIKKSVLELGGSDPFIVMPSANFEEAVSTAVQARVINNGQSCIAAKRFIIDERIADRFEQRFVEQMRALRIGDPLDESTQVGPLATEDVLSDLEKQVNETVRAGARLLLGGKRMDRPGNFYPPTVLADVPKGSPGHDEELFGPVAVLFRCKGIEEAVAIANDTQFGLGSNCWTNDHRERDYFIDNIQAGMAFVNGMTASDPRIPFGGVKQSGYGRELSVFGIREFVNIKTVVIREVAANKTMTE
jgi:succinate-semialdehyde dehydrogenase/glutarate-semialdehyde dehydrogenase